MPKAHRLEIPHATLNPGFLILTFGPARVSKSSPTAGVKLSHPFLTWRLASHSVGLGFNYCSPQLISSHQLVGALSSSRLALLLCVHGEQRWRLWHGSLDREGIQQGAIRRFHQIEF